MEIVLINNRAPLLAILHRTLDRNRWGILYFNILQVMLRISKFCCLK